MTAVHDFIRTSGLDDQAYVLVKFFFFQVINLI